MTEQLYYNTANNQQYAFDPTVAVTPNAGGGFTFTAADGQVLPESTIATMVAGPAPVVLPTLAQAQATQGVIVDTACQDAIVAGFTSSALGSSYNYGCSATDQRNIDFAAVAGGSIWCQTGTAAWGLTPHTAAQAQAVQTSMIAHIQAQQSIYAGLLTQINEATTVAAVQAIVWP